MSNTLKQMQAKPILVEIPEATLATSAQMQWKGRKLMCNGVCVARVEDRGFTGDFYANYADTYAIYRSEANARRAVNRRFKLPVDLGETK